MNFGNLVIFERKRNKKEFLSLTRILLNLNKSNEKNRNQTSIPLRYVSLFQKYKQNGSKLKSKRCHIFFAGFTKKEVSENGTTWPTNYVSYKQNIHDVQKKEEAKHAHA